MDHAETILNAWNSHRVGMDWAGMESALVLILKDPNISDKIKIAFVKEAIDAFTKRGYFHSREYNG